MRWSCDQPCHITYASIHLEPFKWVIAWRDMISPAQFASMLDKAFFPKWLQVSSQDVSKHELKLVMSICLLSPKPTHVPKYLRHTTHAKYLRGVNGFHENKQMYRWCTVCVAETKGNCMKTQLVEKVPEQGQVFRDIVTTQVNIFWLPDTLIHFHHPYIWQHLQPNWYVFVYSKTTFIW